MTGTGHANSKELRGNRPKEVLRSKEERLPKVRLTKPLPSRRSKQPSLPRHLTEANSPKQRLRASSRVTSSADETAIATGAIAIENVADPG